MFYPTSREIKIMEVLSHRNRLHDTNIMSMCKCQNCKTNRKEKVYIVFIKHCACITKCYQKRKIILLPIHISAIQSTAVKTFSLACKYHIVYFSTTTLRSVRHRCNREHKSGNRLLLKHNLPLENSIVTAMKTELI